METTNLTQTQTQSFAHAKPGIRNRFTALSSFTLLGAMLCALAQRPVIAQPLPRAAARSDVIDQYIWYENLDAYKLDAAKHVMRKNRANTFAGKLPPMLPAVVVLMITVDETGRTTEISVHRSPDDEATAVAIASIYHAGRLPRPFNLAVGPGRSLTYSETFLFNADYRFQIRTLAPRQGEN